jgi:PAS domain S-box-containing protein
MSLMWKRLVFAFRGGARLTGIEDEGTARSFHLLLGCALVWALLLLLVVVPVFALRKTGAAIIAGVLCGATLVALHLVRARRIRQAALVFLPVVWCVAEGLSALSGGTRGSAQGMLVLMIVDAGWLLGSSSAIALTAATLLVAIAEAALEYSGHPLPLYFPGTPAIRCATFCGALMFAVGPILSMLANLRQRVAALRESEERFRAIVDSVNDAIFVHEIDTGRILEVNQRAREMYGYSSEEMGHLSLEALSQGHPPYSQADAVNIFARARAGAPLVFEWLARHRDGQTFWVEIAIRRARVAGEERLVVVVRDIAERKRADEERARMEAQLHQAQKMESVGQLAAGVAHDFNNLLTVINGYAGMLAGQLPPHLPQRDEAEQILRAGERAAELTSQLLVFSRKQPVRVEVLDLNLLILDSKKMLKTVLGEGIELTMALEPGLGRVRADRGQLNQVLMNLAVNARHAMTDEGRLHIATVLANPSGTFGSPTLAPPCKCVALSVADTGHGMDAATRERIFEPFFTTKETGEGTGLGLATVYGIVRQSGGCIQVDSEPDRGTTFRIFLPVTHAPESKSWLAAQPAARLANPATILLVEDQAAVSKYLALVLRKGGYTVLTAGTPGEAIAMLSEHGRKLHAVVSDVIMPGMSGPEMVSRMRTFLPDLKVLFISGYPADVLPRHAAQVESFEYLPKPIQPGDLLSRLEALIR